VGPDGRIRVMYSQDVADAAVAADIRRLLR
jgi:hypothetical protein